MVQIPSTGAALQCAADGCDGAPWQGGWHHVKGCDRAADRWHRVRVSVFVCSAHLDEAEAAMVEHVRTNADEAWSVETFRMYGWDDDGRGSAYVVATGDPSETEQLSLF